MTQSSSCSEPLKPVADYLHNKADEDFVSLLLSTAPGTQIYKWNIVSPPSEVLNPSLPDPSCFTTALVWKTRRAARAASSPWTVKYSCKQHRRSRLELNNTLTFLSNTRTVVDGFCKWSSESSEETMCYSYLRHGIIKLNESCLHPFVCVCTWI